MQTDVRLLRRPFLFYLKKYPRPFAIGMGALILTNVLDGIWPLILKEGIDRITADVEMSEIARTSLIFFFVMGSLSVTRYTWRMGFGYLHTLTAEDLRLRAFRHLSRLTPSFFLKKPVGELMSLLTNDIQIFRNAIGSGLLIFTDGILILLIVIPIMISLNATWTMKALLFLPVVPILIWMVMKRIHQAAKNQQDAFARVTAHSQESVAGIRVVKGFALEDIRLDQFNKESKSFEVACNQTAKIDSLFHPIMEVGVTAGSILFLFAAKDDMISGAATVGTFVAFHRYIMKTVWPMTALGAGLSQLQKGFGAFDRIRELFQESPEFESGQDETLNAFESLEFKNVSFKYPGTDRWALRNISFTLRKGQSLGISGPVGSGKTTLLALMTRQYRPQSGEIFLNGRPIQEFSLEKTRRLLTLVPQDVFLFSDTVTWNLGFGRTTGLEEAEAEVFAKHVDIHDEVVKLPLSYQSLIGEKGVTLSGGQKQRLALARGLVMDSQVLILDDVLSAVDTKTEHRIDEMLKTLRKAGRTQILVAHRFSTLKNCSEILILNDGEVEFFGDQKIAQTQSSYISNLQEIQGARS